MAYKRNPMRSERLCGLARFVMSLAASAAQTAADAMAGAHPRRQRQSPTDAAASVLDRRRRIAAGPEHQRWSDRQYRGDRPTTSSSSPLHGDGEPFDGGRSARRRSAGIHECIRRHSQAVTTALKAGAGSNDLLDRLQAEPLLAEWISTAVLEQGQFVGRSPQQVDEFLAEEIEPIRQRYRSLLGQTAEVSV